MDALQSNTNHSLQAELRERNEQYNQLWVSFQRQVAFQSMHGMPAFFSPGRLEDVLLLLLEMEQMMPLLYMR